jgi:2,3,4,5-tetrahydropyridine-2-carboxylate N-succinyltransferase
MKDRITLLYDSKPSQYTTQDRELFDAFVAGLNDGSIRACEPQGGNWVVHEWVKMGILLGFRMGLLARMPWSDKKAFYDKDTLLEKQFSLEDQVRIVPGGSSARNGCYIARGVAIMPPAFINIGAYIDSGSLVDSHALVGSCAQIGKHVHLSAGAMIGGVLEPIGMRPVIVEDNAFIGGNTGIYEGITIGSGAVIASGTVITASTPVFDSVHSRFVDKDSSGAFIIPANAVVVPGSRRMKQHPDFQIYCPIIVKYRDSKTESSVALEEDLRSLVD